MFATRLDGLRCLALKSDGEAFPMSRRVGSLTLTFPTLVRGLQTLLDQTALDAEFVVAGGESYHSLTAFVAARALKAQVAYAGQKTSGVPPVA
jgi:ATP-dependent DNA ligase